MILAMGRMYAYLVKAVDRPQLLSKSALLFHFCLHNQNSVVNQLINREAMWCKPNLKSVY